MSGWLEECGSQGDRHMATRSSWGVGFDCAIAVIEGSCVAFGLTESPWVVRCVEKRQKG